MKNKPTGGFTLIELVVVIVILGILMAIAIPKYIDVTGKAERSADRAQLAALRTVTHLLFASNIVNDVKVSYVSGLVTNQGYWPAVTQIWDNVQKSNGWQYYTGTVSYAQSSGVWAVQGEPNE